MLDSVEQPLSNQGSVDFERIKVLLNQAKAAIAGSLILSLLVFLGLWGEVPEHYLFVFVIYQFLVGISRFILTYKLSSSVSVGYGAFTSKQLRHYEHLCAIGSFFCWNWLRCFRVFVSTRYIFNSAISYSFFHCGRNSWRDS